MILEGGVPLAEEQALVLEGEAVPELLPLEEAVLEVALEVVHVEAVQEDDRGKV